MQETYEFYGIQLFFSWKPSFKKSICFILDINNRHVFFILIQSIKAYYGKRFFESKRIFKSFYKFPTPIFIKTTDKIRCEIKFEEPYKKKIHCKVNLVCDLPSLT